LSHIKISEHNIHSTRYWRFCNFISFLYLNGILLREGEDSLVWSLNIATGKVIAREAYDSLVFSPWELLASSGIKNYGIGIFHKN